MAVHCDNNVRTTQVQQQPWMKGMQDHQTSVCLGVNLGVLMLSIEPAHRRDVVVVQSLQASNLWVCDTCRSTGVQSSMSTRLPKCRWKLWAGSASPLIVAYVCLHVSAHQPFHPRLTCSERYPRDAPDLLKIDTREKQGVARQKSAIVIQSNVGGTCCCSTPTT